METLTTMQVKTIDVHAKEWFDRINGNSYFSARITLNYGMEDEKTLCLPYQYGYGNHYVDMAMKELYEKGILPDMEQYKTGGRESMWRYCERHKIIDRTSKEENCKKRDVVAYGFD